MSNAARERARLWWVAEQKRIAAEKRRAKQASKHAHVQSADDPTDGMQQGDGYYHDQHGEPHDL